MVRFRVLGPLGAVGGRGPLDLKGPRHRAVLARLLVARGRVVPVTRLIDDLWDDDAPDGALGAVQTFVGALRKALEPDRPPRAPARLLVTVPPGYALRAGEADEVDAWRFEAAVGEAARSLAAGRPAEAKALLDDVLDLWRGPAYAEFADRPWAHGEAARLDEVRLLAVERRAEAALALGAAAESVPDLRAHVTAHPLREDGRRLLALALYRTGRQGEALATLRQSRDVLRAELGVDPGHALRRLETDILAQSPALAPEPPPEPSSARSTPFVGRADELAELVRAARTGRRLALVSGTAGAGKTALAEELAARLAAAGWATAWGTCAEDAPAAWPWTRMAEALALGDDLPAGRFERHRAIAAALARREQPVLLVFDDLHRADDDTLALVTSLAADPDAGRVLIVGTYRSTEISAALTGALGRAARTEPARVHLGGLTEARVRDLVEAVTDRAPTDADVRAIHTRSGGNPFFVRELTRLWETDPALSTVPAGVRDVLRHRLAQLSDTARTHLRQASVLGQEVDLDVLVPLAGDEDVVLDSVESALLAGFLVEPDADRLRFAHALVQETLYDDIAHARRARWHAAAADVVERVRPDDVEAVAHHLLRAGNRVAAARTAHHTRAAAERAERRSAPHQAARWWRETLARTGGPDRLDAVMGLVRALAVTGDLDQARRHRARAVAEVAGDPVLTARTIGSFDVPAIWTTNDDEALSADLVDAAERALDALPPGHDAERARLLVTIAMERRADTGRRGRDAALEAEAVARELDDPALLALALNGRFLQTCHRAGLAPDRARIGAELLDLAARHGLVTFEVLAHLILVQSHAALADLAAADRHAAAADALAERHDLPLVGVFTTWYAALRLAVTGRRDEARAAYRAAASRLSGAGMPGVERGILPLALLGLGDVPDADWGPYEPWARPVVLLARGERAEALAAVVPDSPHDLLFEVRTCLHAVVAVEAGDRPTMARLYDRLLPAAGELAGAGSGLVAFGPTAHHLAALAAALGRPGQAAGHRRRARRIAAALGAPQWTGFDVT
ncbi:BTAD domain-containing putative transcriptional regulator [Saccharothrix texasensis]|uniref:DNA-binding SARP family transcriptional activator n=1 Tax=Saccharothrix texasensis TaxID=103734 RepID=A0A3N1HGP4_9PSEU|nr:BTAD domain-containing putative transcriptional regulator [Saccharothrix texasensis]ROP41650.1 DNA-binding SARP family transcriptional activator [Saccharothrix texasensis]